MAMFLDEDFGCAFLTAHVTIDSNTFIFFPLKKHLLTPMSSLKHRPVDPLQVEERSRAKALVRRDSEVIDVEAATSTGSFRSCRMDKPLFWRVDLPEAWVPFLAGLVGESHFGS